MIEINNLYKIYKMGDVEVRALDNIHLQIQKHDFVSIIGPSGSGKSTLMNILGCLDTPTSGSYHLDGDEVSTLSENQLAEIRNKKIGFVFQKFNLIPKLTAVENVELPLIYMGVPPKERYERALKSLDVVGLLDRISHNPTELSGGQQQRVAIARALVTDPPIILADEPTGNLDSHSEKEVMSFIDNLNKAGNTIILITHDDSVARRAEKIFKILDGKLEEVK